MTHEELKALPIHKMLSKAHNIDRLLMETFVFDYIEGQKIDNRYLKELITLIINIQKDIIAELANMKNVEL